MLLSYLGFAQMYELYGNYVKQKQITDKEKVIHIKILI